MNSLPDDIERIMTALETTEGILGANVISRGYGASIVALVIHYLISIGAEHWPRGKRWKLNTIPMNINYLKEKTNERNMLNLSARSLCENH